MPNNPEMKAMSVAPAIEMIETPIAPTMPQNQDAGDGTPPQLVFTLLARQHASAAQLASLNRVGHAVSDMRALIAVRDSNHPWLEEAARRVDSVVRSELRALINPPAPRVGSTFAVLSLFDELKRRLADHARAAGIALLMRCDRARMIGDCGALGQALFNIVLNAIQASPRHGKVTVSAECWPGGEMAWCVADEGAGLPRPVLRTLGLPVAMDVGVAVGVAVATAIVERHGGLVRVATSAGGGTRFTLWLPGRLADLSGP